VIIVDRALEDRASTGRPVQVAMVGAGAMGRGIARQVFRAFPGLRLAAIANRTVANAQRAYAEAGADECEIVDSVAAVERAVNAGRFVVTDDPTLLAEAEGIEVLIEVTGTVEEAAHTVEAAIRGGKHVVLMNAELDGTIGPILKTHADAAGVILSACDGDQPGVEANLYRFVKGIGLRPLVCGNIKGLQDPYRTPTTQAEYAQTWGLGVAMVTSFADGTKVSYEQAIVANGMGMRAPRRGLYQWEHHGHVDELTTRYDHEELERLGGIVDYVVGAQPAPGVYVIATHDDELERHYMKLYKRGDGPLYSFYTPQHLCHFEVPTSVARVALLGDPVLAPLGGPLVEVIATAKRDLKAGEVIDGIGGYLTYGQCENTSVVRADRILPMGVAEGCRVTRDIARDGVLTYDDVDIPPGRLVDRLYAEQETRFPASA
jgi:predicted homoserine dehydrogenase-like protein